MAGKGLLSPPSGYTRISPGVYRNKSGQTWKSGQAAPSASGVKASVQRAPGAATSDKFKGQGKGTSKIINQQQGRDVAVGGIAAKQLPGLQQQYSQGPDYSGVQSLGTAQNYQDWVNQNMNAANQAFSSANDENFANQAQAKQQELANRGIPQGDPEYAREMKQISDQQNSARNQATSLAYGNAVQGAQSLSGTNIALNQAGMGNVNSQYMQPLQTYSALQGAISPIGNEGFQAANQLAGSQIGANAQMYGDKLAAGAKNAQTAAAYNPNNYQNSGMNYADYAALNQQNALGSIKAQQPATGSSLLSAGAGILGQAAGSYFS